MVDYRKVYSWTLQPPAFENNYRIMNHYVTDATFVLTFISVMSRLLLCNLFLFSFVTHLGYLWLMKLAEFFFFFNLLQFGRFIWPVSVSYSSGDWLPFRVCQEFLDGYFDILVVFIEVFPHSFFFFLIISKMNFFFSMEGDLYSQVLFLHLFLSWRTVFFDSLYSSYL